MPASRSDGLMMRMSEAAVGHAVHQRKPEVGVQLHPCRHARHDEAEERKRSSTWRRSWASSGNAGQCNYSASKAGMIGLAKSIAKEMGPRGIRANAIAPGFIITDMTNTAVGRGARRQWAKQIPLRRGGTPEDVAKVALFLASDLSSYVSGQVIHVLRRDEHLIPYLRSIFSKACPADRLFSFRQTIGRESYEHIIDKRGRNIQRKDGIYEQFGPLLNNASTCYEPIRPKNGKPTRSPPPHRSDAHKRNSRARPSVPHEANRLTLPAFRTKQATPITMND